MEESLIVKAAEVFLAGRVSQESWEGGGLLILEAAGVFLDVMILQELPFVMVQGCFLVVVELTVVFLMGLPILLVDLSPDPEGLW